jgi:hypothetical protein
MQEASFCILGRLTIGVERCIPQVVCASSQERRQPHPHQHHAHDATHICRSGQQIPQLTIGRVDKTFRDMIWKGASSCSDGDCQVARMLVYRLKFEGGLSIINLEV